jgi:predicted ATPase
VLRAQGEILLAAPRPDLTAAEKTLMRSLNCARKQSALGWELRAALPLARMWAEHGRAVEARAMLAGIHRQFIEGFWTADLTAASLLLAELNEIPRRAPDA